MYTNREEVHVAVRESFNKRQEMHPAFSEWHEPRAYTWRPLWDGILKSDVLESWQQDSSKWMLRCVGAPGSGKTTFSALVMANLKDNFRGKGDAVACIFLRTDVSSSDASFVEDVLESVLHQLCAKHIRMAADEAGAYVARYQQCFATGEHGHHDDFRMKILRDALHSCLDLLDRAFLVIDGIDKCSPAVELLLENELLSLAAKGLKVILTSRIRCCRTSSVAFCDYCPQESRKCLGVYWICNACKERGVGGKDSHVLCQSCKAKGITCKNCGNLASFILPYNYVELDLSFNQQSFERFIDRDLEIEHGDLGLYSTNEDKPPHSDLGRDLVMARNHDALTILRRRIAHQSGANISLALLHLSNVHRLRSVDSILSPPPDVLPANIVAFFHAGMRRIGKQSRSQRDLGLKAIAAAAHCGYRRGIKYDVLDRLLQTPTKTLARHQPTSAQSGPVVSTIAGTETRRSPLVIPSHHRLDEILHAACGFLVVDNPVDALHLATIRTYCEEFHVYAREKYSESLLWAHSELDFDSVGLYTDSGLAKSSSRSVRRSQTAKVGAKDRVIVQGTFPPAGTPAFGP
ncbi:hypothetical protein LX32DRAFT_621504 [Colletotrichum zoysiae]|uniref:Nephrocystin 3-like N-terminal domain-containing protein n=1 Tax=Colletotrichum zoysiae TaxID=1216348 RepID=A0AAD9LZT2_9PEZI|nr:hypothetical protein LX32DRAFT_621504 [Colletotrichum zoysiae]